MGNQKKPELLYIVRFPNDKSLVRLYGVSEKATSSPEKPILEEALKHLKTEGFSASLQGRVFRNLLECKEELSLIAEIPCPKQPLTYTWNCSNKEADEYPGFLLRVGCIEVAEEDAARADFAFCDRLFRLPNGAKLSN